MALIVRKSMRSRPSGTYPSRIKNVARRVAGAQRAGQRRRGGRRRRMTGETNRLLELATRSHADPDAREMDVLAATGEQVTVGARWRWRIQAQGGKARVASSAHQVKILTDSAFTKARIKTIDAERLARGARARARSRSSPASRASTRRATSPRSAAAARTPRAVAIAAALDAERVRDLHRRRRRLHDRPEHLPDGARSSTASATRRCSSWRRSGAKVLQIRSVEFAMKYRSAARAVLARAIAGHRPPGTLVTCEEDDNMENASSPASPRPDEAKITVHAASPDRPGVACAHLRPARRREHRRRHDRPERRRRRHDRPHVHRARTDYLKGARAAGRRDGQGARRARDQRRRRDRQGLDRRRRMRSHAGVAPQDVRARSRRRASTSR